MQTFELTGEHVMKKKAQNRLMFQLFFLKITFSPAGMSSTSVIPLNFWFA